MDLIHSISSKACDPVSPSVSLQLKFKFKVQSLQHSTLKSRFHSDKLKKILFNRKPLAYLKDHSATVSLNGPVNFNLSGN